MILRQNTFFLIVFALCMGLNSGPLRAETSGTVNPNSEKGTVSISIGEWPPYTSSHQKHNGVIAHIIQDVFSEMGLKVQFQTMPWARAYEEAASGRFDGTGVWMHKQEREKDFIYSDPILEERFVFFHLKDDPFDWKALEDLKGSMMGGVRASSYGPEMDAAIESGLLTMTRVTRFHQNYSRLLLRRVRLVPMEVNVGYSMIREHIALENQNLITHHPKAFLENFSYVLFPKKSKESKNLVLKFNKQLKIFRKSGRYDQYMADLKAGKYELDKKKSENLPAGFIEAVIFAAF